MKTKILSLLCIVLLVLSLCACGSAKIDPGTKGTSESITESTTEPTSEQVTADVSSWNWKKCELDCFNYSIQGFDYYMSFEYPDVFTAADSNDSGEQYRGFNYNPADPEAKPNDSPYGIYAYFTQGSYGAKRASLEEDMGGKMEEREIGGRTILFGQLPNDPNTGACAFAYYLSYSEDEWARIWVILTDPEEDGEFRQTFEKSVSFIKD